MGLRKSVRLTIARAGGYLLPSLFLCAPLHADTIQMKNGDEIKGLVVEQHSDRVIISTEKGEIPVMLDLIKNVEYEDPAQNFFQLGKARETDGKFGEALAYYEKALEANPDFAEAEKAAMGVRNRFWASSTEGPQGEVEKQQAINDSWKRGRTLKDGGGNEAVEMRRGLKDGLGLTLEKRGDWVRISQVESKKDAAFVGLKKGDRLVQIDGESLRYLGLDVVVRAMSEPRFSNFTLEYDRDVFVKKADAKNLKDLGLKMKLKYDGLFVEGVEAGSRAEAAGMREGDLLTHVEGKAVRYMAAGKVNRIVDESGRSKVALTVRRTALLTRK